MTTDLRHARVALIHDHLTQNGGAEQVLRQMMRVFPEAPVYTLVHDERRLDPQLSTKNIHTSFLQHLPFSRSFLQFYFPLMPRAIESFDLSAYDVIISSASSFAKGVTIPKSSVHICYCHTPTRYLWGDADKYLDELKYPRLLKRLARFFLPNLRRWEQDAVKRATLMVANSETVKERIKKYYDRDASVLYPPVDIQHFAVASTPGTYYLTGGRLVAYKRFDTVVRAFNRLKLPLKIFGSGPDEARLRRMARQNIQFLGFVGHDELPDLYTQCIAFLHPQEEDFGITAVEAMAAGRPVIAYAGGGALETVEEGKSGTFYDEQGWEAIGDAVIRFRPQDFDATHIRAHSEQFSNEAFASGLRSFVLLALQNNS